MTAARSSAAQRVLSHSPSRVSSNTSSQQPDPAQFERRRDRLVAGRQQAHADGDRQRRARPSTATRRGRGVRQRARREPERDRAHEQHERCQRDRLRRSVGSRRRPRTPEVHDHPYPRRRAAIRVEHREDVGAVPGVPINLRERPPDHRVDARRQPQHVDPHLRRVGLGELGIADVAPLAAAIEHPHAAVVALQRLGHEHAHRRGRFAQRRVDRRVGASQQRVSRNRRRILQHGDGRREQHDRREQPASHCAPDCAPTAARSISSSHSSSVRRPRQSCQPWNSPGATANAAPSPSTATR